jgi:outer membrane biogenesis lipoprotein LolB
MPRVRRDIWAGTRGTDSGDGGAVIPIGLREQFLNMLENPANGETAAGRLYTAQRWLEMELTKLDPPVQTLRDWFAGQALAGMHMDPWAPNQMAKQAYVIADAMMKARERDG